MVKCIFMHFYTKSTRDESAKTLLDLLVKRKTNKDFDQFCEALHQTKQTSVVKNLLATPGLTIVISYLIPN